MRGGIKNSSSPTPPTLAYHTRHTAASRQTHRTGGGTPHTHTRLAHTRTLAHAAAGCNAADIWKPRLLAGRLLGFLLAAPGSRDLPGAPAPAPAAAAALRTRGAGCGSGADSCGASTGRPCGRAC